MILGNLAKADRMQFKKLSYFRLVFYKLYAGNQKRSNQKVENLVESVEFSTGFSTCGKIIALLRIVYRVFVENFFLRQNRGISTQQPGKADAGRQNISAKKRKRSPAPRTEKLLQDADKKR